MPTGRDLRTSKGSTPTVVPLPIRVYCDGALEPKMTPYGQTTRHPPVDIDAQYARQVIVTSDTPDNPPVDVHVRLAFTCPLCGRHPQLRPETLEPFV